MSYYNFYECETCYREFSTQHGANQHMNALDHWAERYECETCNAEFLDEGECEDHMYGYNHWAPKHACEACNEMFHTPQAARQHMDAQDHWRKIWCAQCRKGFQNENNLKMHLKGSAHLGTNNLTCPFCKRGFATATGLVHHAESGGCPNAKNLNREVIYKAIRAKDTSGLVTHKQLEWHSQSNSSFEATIKSWNGYSYECYLCHREFASLNSLNQHLNSPTHKQKIYHCVSKKKCGKEFTSLAALFNHLESESCGAVRFDGVQKSVEGILTGRMKMLNF